MVKLLTSKKRKVSPKKTSEAEPRKVVLVGTYKTGQLDWILENGVYNWPVREDDEFTSEQFAQIDELWLYANVKSERRVFSAVFIRKMASAEFRAAYPTYVKLGVSKQSAYYVFNVKPVDYPSELGSRTVLARAADFGKRCAKVKKAIEQFREDGEIAPLVAYLPKELGKVPQTQLRVCERAVQIDLWGESIAGADRSVPEIKLVMQDNKRVADGVSECKMTEAIRPFLNTIINGDSAEVLKSIPENSIDLVVTSPPYDQIRDYNGFTLDLHAIGTQLYRVVKPGGVVAMVIQDSTKNFAKTLTSFRTIVDWCDNVGFKMFETVIYHKNGTEGAWWTHRFRVDHEYMPIFFKGDRPAYFNKGPLKIPSKWGGKVMTGSGNRRTSGETTKTVTRPINLMKCRGTVWDYMMAGDKNPLKRKHPAVFPDKIPLDFIQCFCPPGGVVLDPFIGCGSTAVTAKGLGRNYIGIDISAEYCTLAEERIRVDFNKYAQQEFEV